MRHVPKIISAKPVLPNGANQYYAISILTADLILWSFLIGMNHMIRVNAESSINLSNQVVAVLKVKCIALIAKKPKEIHIEKMSIENLLIWPPFDISKMYM